MPKSVMRKVKLSELKCTFFVRTQLDQEHVLKLADLYLAGVALPPLKITQANEVVDGRHRKEAMEVAFLQPHREIDVEVVSEDGSPELIALALKSNEGGSKQPTRADIVHTIRLMLLERASEKRIYDLLADVYPKAVVRKYLEAAKRTLKRSAIQAAKEDVANGSTVKEAAEKHGIEVVDLKKAIAPSVGINQDRLKVTLREITNRYFALSRANQALAKRMVMGYADGDVNEGAVSAILEKIDFLSKRQVRQVEDWRLRFSAAKRGQLVNWREIIEESEAA